MLDFSSSLKELRSDFCAAVPVPENLRSDLVAACGDSQHPALLALQRHWYESLRSSHPDFSVYSDPLYAADIWHCWKQYTRKSVSFALTSSGAWRGLDASGIRSVLDVGNGFGLSSSFLAERSQAAVFGSNIPDTTQFKFAKSLGGFEMCEAGAEPQAELLIALEYFEHFREPIVEAARLLRRSSPTTLLIANSFGTEAIGHFVDYVIGGKLVHGGLVGKLFNGFLRQCGYRIIASGWNRRPALWRKE